MDILSKKNICQVSSRHKTNDTRVYYKIARSLRKISPNVSVIGIETKDNFQENIKIISVSKCKKFISICMLKRIISIYKISIKEDADLYQLHDPELIPLGLYLKKIKKKKVIFDQHEFVSVTVRGNPLLKTIRLILKHSFFWLVGLSYRYFDLIVCSTQGIYDQAKGNKCVVANFVDLELIKKIDYKKNEIFSVIFVGGLSLDRSIYDLVESIGELNNEGIRISLNLIGRWEVGLEDKCKELDGWKYTTYHGILNSIEVYNIMKRCHIGMSVLKPLENYMEGWSVKTFEYMACGLPVIGSNFPKWKSFYKDTIMYCEPTKEGIKKAIKDLYENKELRELLIKKGEDLVITKCNWESQERILFEKIFELYEDKALTKKNNK
ncbi:MAG: glycosyltransferase [Methanofastidiosum sp.]